LITISIRHDTRYIGILTCYYCCTALLDGSYRGALQIVHCIVLYCCSR